MHRQWLLWLVVLAAGTGAQSFAEAVARFEQERSAEDPARRRRAVLALAAPGDPAILEVLSGPLRDWCHQAEVARRERAGLQAALERARADRRAPEPERRRRAALQIPRLEDRLARVEARLRAVTDLRDAALTALARVATRRGGEYLATLRRRAFRAPEGFVQLAYVEVLARTERPEVADWLLERVVVAARELQQAAARRARAEKKLAQALRRLARRPTPANEERVLTLQTDTAAWARAVDMTRRVVVAALAGWRTRVGALAPAARGPFLTRALRALRGLKLLAVESRLAEALAAFPRPEVVQALTARLQAARLPARRVAYLRALGASGRREVVPEVLAALADSAWPVRAAAVEALVALRDPRAIPALIGRLKAEKGRLSEDIEEALVRLTGQRLGFRPEAWARWWAEHKARFQVPPSARTPPAPLGGSGFYGIPTRSRRILYVVDVSGSMAEEASGGGSKYDRARAELLQAVGALPRGALFNVIFYATRVRVWSPTPVPAGPAARRRLEESLAALRPGGATNAYGALMAALNLAGAGATGRRQSPAYDTVYFLSDGHPTVGAVVAPEQILAEVEARNRLGRIRIHAVGVGREHNVAFLRRLAEMNGGRYVAP